MGHLFATWASIYSDHAALRTAIDFVHIGGLLVAGGCAIAADRTLIRAVSEEPAVRAVHLRWVGGVHRVVILGLVAVVFSGLLQFTADLDTFLHSGIFWLKMALVVALLANGALLVRTERRIEKGDAGAWSRLRTTSGISLALWLLTTLAGTALLNI